MVSGRREKSNHGIPDIPYSISLEEKTRALHSIEAERAVISCLLQDVNAFSRVNDILKPYHFSIEALAILYSVITELTEKNEGSPPDLTELTIHLTTVNLKDAIGGTAALMQYKDEAVFPTNIERYANTVINRWQLREGCQTLSKLQQVFEDPYIEYEEKINRFNEAVVSFHDIHSTATRKTSFDGQELFDRYSEQLTTKQIPKFKCGLADLDNILGGFRPTNIAVIAGRPGMGKTALGLHIYQSLVKSTRKKGIYFSIEMDTSELYHRLCTPLLEKNLFEARLKAQASEETRNLLRRINNNTHTEEDLGILLEAMAEVSALPIQLDYCPGASVAYIEAKISQAVLIEQTRLRLTVEREGGTYNPEEPVLSCVFVDYLQLLTYEGKLKDGNRNLEVGEMSRALKVMAGRYNVPIILLSQLSRSLESRRDKRPIMSDLRESGQIEQDASQIIMLYREAVYNPHTPDHHVLEALVRKNRFDREGVAKLGCNLELMDFWNLGL